MTYLTISTVSGFHTYATLDSYGRFNDELPFGGYEGDPQFKAALKEITRVVMDFSPKSDTLPYTTPYGTIQVADTEDFGTFTAVRVGDEHIAMVKYQQKEDAKAAGFSWNPDRRQWIKPA
jgi:hypothetical protein